MARRDERSRNNRKTVTETRQRTRTVDGGTRQMEIYGDFGRNGGHNASGAFYPGAGATGRERYALLNEGEGRTKNGYLVVDDGAKFTTKEGYSATYYNVDTNDPYGTGRLVVDVENPDKRVTETLKSTRQQALDKRSSDSDAQKKRDLKTKREGRNKLRIQLSGDGSSARLKGGPNSGRRKNKLKIDVQGGGGNTGINAPR